MAVVVKARPLVYVWVWSITGCSAKSVWYYGCGWVILILILSWDSSGFKVLNQHLILKSNIEFRLVLLVLLDKKLIDHWLSDWNWIHRWNWSLMIRLNATLTLSRDWPLSSDRHSVSLATVLSEIRLRLGSITGLWSGAHHCKCNCYWM